MTRKDRPVCRVTSAANACIEKFSPGKWISAKAGRGFDPTAEAAALIPHAMAMREAAARLALAAAGQDAGLEGTVRVTASRLIAVHVLPDIIAGLRHLQPRIQIEIVPLDTTEHLLFREADIALRMDRPTQADVITRHLTDLEVGFYAAPANLDRRGRPMQAEDLLDHDIASFDRRDTYLRGFAEYGMTPRREDFPLRCDDSVVLWAMVRAGCGIGISNVLLARDDPAVERVLPDFAPPRLPVWLTAAEPLRHTPRIRAVIDYLAAGFLRLPTALADALTAPASLARPTATPSSAEPAMANPTLLILAGDGIGPEVMAEVKKIISWFGTRRGVTFDVTEDLVGGCAYDKHGTPLHDDTMAKAQEVDAVLLGAVGGPKYDTLDFSVKPERGLLRLRKEMDLFSNLRPAQCFDALADFSSLKKEVVAGLDIVIVRELTSGVYFGEPRGIFVEGNERVGINTQRYTESEIARVARSAFELARRRDNKVCSMEKANVMESGILWREVVQKVHDEEYPEVQLSHMYADSGAMQLCRWPKQFDVIVTDNLFGDLLSDMAAMLTGSLGMLPSASLGMPMANGRPKALYEPVHGSAPDIAGTGKANPIACILSFAMALRYSFDMGGDATRVEKAVEKVLADGVRTADLMGPEGGMPVSTSQMGDAVIAALEDSL